MNAGHLSLLEQKNQEEWQGFGNVAGITHALNYK